MTASHRLIPSSLAAAILLGAAASACAADDTIATDRPDFVESSAVVGKQRLQIETSFALDRSNSRGASDVLRSTPTLVRFGVSDTVELRVETDGALRQRSRTADTGTARERGYGDLSLGLKWHAMDAAGAAPAVALLLHADLSSGSAAFRAPGTRPSARLVAEWELPQGMSFGLMPGIGYEQHDGGRKAFGMLGATIGKSFTERLRGFAEISSPRIIRSAYGGTEAIATTGLAYLLRRNLQIDTALSRGLNSRSPDLSLTVGVSVKF